MSRVWRRFAIWLVVLVLPLQGLAANAAMRCLLMPDTPPPRAAVVAELPPCHAQMLADSPDPAGDALVDQTRLPCPHCMACMALGAAAWPLAAVPPTVGVLTQAEGRRAEPPHHAIVFVTDGPDRPPRTTRA